ncbi:MAG: M23 family metallopeptidase [Acidobacteriaceae bacterium]|nr:M23 family metallopeptidase [Acidobacteriaceae bacterium]MBV8569725.1 M23 family metallopeptidase [Acidobacteriaceae bacterium]
MLKYVLAVVAAIILIVFGLVWFSGKKAEVKLARPVAAIGTSTTVLVQVNDPAGVKRFTAAVEQNGQKQKLFEDTSKSKQKGVIYSFDAGQKQASFLKEGPATLILQAKSNDFRGATTTLEQSVNVVLKPPTIVADGHQHYINQGGSELVVLDLGGNWTEAGVRVANYSAGTFPMPGEPDSSNHRFSLFPFPWDVSAQTIPLAFARNGAGTEVTTTFWVKVFPKKFRASNIQLNDRELQKVVGELDPSGSGSLIDRFVKINREMRRANAQQIYELHNNTEHRILWNGPFIPIKGARESYFADRRSYYYNGKKVDEQVHLGYDLAATTNMPVKAANSGKVIWADRLGIYGNCVIIDHGYSLESLYGHMSKIGVKVGDTVQKEQQIGISGSTGMAFGDHVHFSMLVDGVQIDPKEWWDEHWIHDRILSKIGPNATAETAKAAARPVSTAHPEAAVHKHHKKHRG